MSDTTHTTTDAPYASQDSQPTDPSRLALPPVDTSMRLWRGLTVKEAKFFAPAAVVGFGSVLGALLGRIDVGALGLVVAGVLFVAGGVGYAADRWWTSAPDRLRNTLQWGARTRRLPWSHAAGETPGLHGIERVTEKGVVVRESGTHAKLIRIHGRNTAMQTPAEDNALARSFGRALDEAMGDIDLDLYSTTRAPDADGLAGVYEHADTPETDAARYRDAVAAWVRETTGNDWGEHEWRHYAVVRARPGDVTHPEASWWSALPLVGSVDAETEHERLVGAVEAKAERVVSAIERVDGLDADPAGAAETVDVLANYWRGRTRGDTGSLEVHAVESDSDQPPATAPALAPDTVDQSGRRLAIEDEFVRTIWIAEWPPEPEPMFLRDLYTARGVDLDVTLCLRAQDQEATMEYLNHETATVDAETMEREEAGDMTALDSDADIDYYLRMREQIQTTPTQPWKLSGYVTVRPADRAALAYAEDVVEAYDSLTLAKDAALADACGAATRLLESEPANCLPVANRTTQLDAFRSGAPTHPDTFADQARVDVRTLVTGGLVGGAFPPCATTPQDDVGLDLGRNTQTMRHLRVNPFATGSAPHCLTLGKSRSGKTFAVSRAVARWYLQADDHHLVVCDTQNGFHGLTQLLDGEHVVVDGEAGINPLDIQPAADYERDAAGGRRDPYRLKVEEATQWVLGILRAQGVADPGQYAAVIEHAIEEAYNRRGIVPHDFASFERPSPTLADFFDVLGDMLDDPESFTFTGHGAEVDRKVERAAGLLERLSGFQEGGKYHRLVSASGEGLLADGVDMSYLDLQQLQAASDAEKSVMLHLMLGQVSQFIKRIDGPTIFVIDEAHMLLHSEAMVQWLQKAAREWARYDACLWFVSQSPREFVQRAHGSDAGEENQRQTIVDQCSLTQVFYTELSEGAAGESETLRQLGMNARQDEFVQEHAARGKNNDYSEALVRLVDEHGWFPTRIEASPLEEHVLTYAPHQGDGPFDKYLAAFDGEAD